MGTRRASWEGDNNYIQVSHVGFIQNVCVIAVVLVI